MSARPARSLDALLGQIDRRYPNRNRDSDGWIGDEDHQTRDSDHNPWYPPPSGGIVTARDFTHDPQVGLDMDRMTDELAAGHDPRIKYMIFNGWILDSRPQYHPWQWVKYFGPNQHTKHMHLSVMDAPLCDNTDIWSLPMLGSDGPVGPVNLSLGSRGYLVRTLQHILNAWYPWVKLKEDGIFGPATDLAVKELQRRAGLSVTGVVDEATRAVLKWVM